MEPYIMTSPELSDILDAHKQIEAHFKLLVRKKLYCSSFPLPQNSLKIPDWNHWYEKEDNLKHNSYSQLEYNIW